MEYLYYATKGPEYVTFPPLRKRQNHCFFGDVLSTLQVGKQTKV